MAKIKPSFDYEICSCCGACAANCPVSVIKMDVKRQRNMCLSVYPRLADEDNCIGCSMCAKTCPLEAITVFEYDQTGASKPAEVEYESYRVIASKCKGCTACARACPVGAISGKVKEAHIIDPDACVQCGLCQEKCKFSAIVRGTQPTEDEAKEPEGVS
ncbi:MAG: 4Fe-4S binding protein [Oscillospiraceae bacterium]